MNEQTPLALAILSNSPGDRQQVTLVAGDNPIDPPQSPQPTATFLVVVPPTGSAVTKKIKGAAGDTGYTLGNAAFFIIPVGTVAGSDGKIGSFLLNASSQEVVWTYWL